MQRRALTFIALLLFGAPTLLCLALSTSTSPMSLQGKRAFVTGSSGGIGAGIAKALAARGASVLVHYNSRHDGAKQTCAAITKQAQDEGGKGSCEGIIQCDFRSPEAIDKMMDYIGGNCWGGQPLDILVNNAGLITKMASDDDDEALSAWHETMAVNLHAPLQLSRLAYRQMKGSGNGGVIINVSSIHGSRSVEWMTAYAASKAALDSLTRGLALEYAPDNVRVNVVAPGIVPVERTAEVLSTKEAQDMWTPHLPVGRMGSVEEIGEATVQLCTNQWMTGTVLSIDGGMMSRANMPFRPRPPVPAPTSATSSDSDVNKICKDVAFERP